MTSWATIHKLSAVPGYVSAFHSLYAEGLQPSTIKDAIAVFERSLVTPASRFDQFLKGHRAALSPQELRGYAYFKSDGCISCHQGVNVGGNLMQPFGVMLAPTALRAIQSKPDHPGFSLTDFQRTFENAGTRFKVPSLRNVARTAPYFHDGSVPSLSEAVKIMGISQLGRRLEKPEVDAIVTFLQTLTGRYEGREL